MADSGAKTLVFSSSATVYGQPQYLPLDEDHPTSATNPYGRTKLMIEEMLADVAAADPEWRIAILRYFNPVGAHDSGLIGENPNGIPNNLMPFISRVAAGRLNELSVFGSDYDTPDGTGVRDYIHVVDLADGHVAALDAIARPISRYRLESRHRPRLFGARHGRGVRARESVSIPYRIAPRRDGDVASCFASPERAARELGWTAGRDLDAMCASSWRFERMLATRNAD
jgi:UDP-glucose 4-epimerase